MNDNKGKVDPGWNDPPMLNYSTSNPPPKSRITNKRVPFPLDNNSPKIPKPTHTNLPPLAQPSFPPLPNKNLPPFSESDSIKEKLGHFFTTNEAREEFYKNWENNLPDACKKTVSLMAECLVNNNKGEAELHKQDLLTHHQKLCENWLNSIQF